MAHRANKLSLDVDKTKYVPFRLEASGNTELSDMQIEEYSSLKNLDVFIDDELKFRDLIDRISRKISKAISIGSNVSHFVSKKVTPPYFNLYIKAVIQYGNLVYDGTYRTQLH